jgi:hypothetical protein
VFLTASHCTEFADRFDSEVWVTFDPTDVERFIHLNQNLAQGWGGTGYGDSGGPTFVDTATGPIQVSTVSTGDVPLYATSVNTRLDTQEAHDFLAPYLP